MSKLSIVAVICFAVSPLVVMQAQGLAPELPTAPITPKVKTACMECHDSGIIVQQRLDRKRWAKEVDKMTNWGALVEKQDRDAFIDYLSSNFPADKPPAAPQYKVRAQAGKKASKAQ